LSLAPRAHQEQYLKYVIVLAEKHGLTELSNESAWTCRELSGPQQRNGCDCGFMTLLFMDQIVRALRKLADLWHSCPAV
jgi:Ulp1 family protease